MTCSGRIVTVGMIAVLSAACGMTTPTAPGAVGTAATAGAFASTESSTRSALGSVSVAAVSCTVDVGATSHPLPAFHVYLSWLNASIEASDLTCGQVNSLDAKAELLAKSLDADPPAFETACGVSTALARDIDALINSGQLAVLTFDAPVEGGPTTLEGIAEDLTEHWCAAARGDITGPR
jgi:hypothetical protein